MNFTFAQPQWLWLLLALPLLAWLTSKRGSAAAVRFPSIAAALKLSKVKRSRVGSFSFMLTRTALALCIVALARPQKLIESGERPLSGIDIMLSVDASSSMLALDMSSSRRPITRLEVVRSVLADFIKKRPSDRIGLVMFAGNPYLVSPLTLSQDWLERSLDRLQAGAIEDGTAIGSALAFCTNRLRSINAKSKIVILLSDGENNAGSISPMLAAEAAAALGVRVYTIAIGSGGRVPTLFIDPSTKKIACDVFGNPHIAEVDLPVDTKTLAEIAQITGGQAFSAKNQAALAEVYNAIDKLERTEAILKSPPRMSEQAPWWLAAAIALLALDYLLTLFVWRRWP